jgi:hypothetical protein
MPMYVVEVNGYQTLIRARTPNVARREAIEGYVTVRVRLATEADVAWQRGMGGAVPEKEARRIAK